MTHSKHLHQILYGINAGAAEQTNHLSLEPLDRIRKYIEIVREEFEQSDKDLELAQQCLALQNLPFVFLDLPSDYERSLIMKHSEK